MDRFITFHYNKQPRDIRRDLISDYKNHIVRIVGRNSLCEFDVDETYDEIKKLINQNNYVLS